MSLSTPILTVLSWASAGLASPRLASAIIAPRCAMVVLIYIPPCVRLFQRVRCKLELLDALSGIDLGGIDVALRIDRHGVNPVELAGVAAVMAEAADHAAVVALQHANLIVLAIGAEQIALLRIRPDRNIPHRTVSERVLFIEPFGHEGAVLLEHLDAVVDAVADIHKAVIGDLDAMHGIAELLRHRRFRIVGGLLVVVRRLAVSAPVPLVGAGGGVEHDDAAVAVAVGDVDFVGGVVDGGLGGLAELGGVVAAFGRRDAADLHHELAVGTEFHDDIVIVGITGEPNIALVVDFDAVLAADPFIAFAGT